MGGSILVVGSVAFDSVKTPFGEVDDILGGSATYFSVASSYFAPVRVVAVVGDDFEDRHIAVFRKHQIDIDGLKRTEGRTFRWKGEYGYDLNECRTLDTQLNVFAAFNPVIPEAYRSSEYVFLGNIDPDLQLSVLEQIKQPRIVACDTMTFWIQVKPDAVERAFRRSIIYGSVMASFNVEQFSLNRLTNLTRSEIDQRFSQFKALTHFEEF